ncbi:hypothetical protein DFH09DRAFT_1280823 [Mycena vulgaris]|nr:hypothetical protein DFH09DRAFT_1280823 [Mycena vulgaris]
MRDLLHIRPPAYHNAYLREELTAMKAKFDGIPDADRAEFIATTAARMVAGRIHARVMRERDAESVRQEAVATAEVIAVRTAEIRQKLYSLGWGDELAAMKPQALSCLKLVKKAEPLTDGVWEAIRPKLERLMQSFRSKEASQKEKVLKALAIKRFNEGQLKLRTPGEL